MSNFIEKLNEDFSLRLSEIRSNENFDLKKISNFLIDSKKIFNETKKNEEKFFKQLEQIEENFVELNRILRLNGEQRTQLENCHEQIDRRAQIMALNGEALECRAAAVQLQQQAKLILSRLNEIEKRTNQKFEEINSKLNVKTTPIELENDSENRNKIEFVQPSTIPERQSANSNLQNSKTINDQKISQNWTIRNFMNDDSSPSCIIRVSTNLKTMPIRINSVPIFQTENLIEEQEELISLPIEISFDQKLNDENFIILALPHLTKRSNHRENVIKIRTPNGQWTSVETIETSFETHKEKHFVECRISESSKCAVVCRLKREQIVIEREKRGKFTSSADGRFTAEWSKETVRNQFSIDARLQPVDPVLFNKFCQDYFHDCQGLISVSPIVELIFDDFPLLKPIEFTFPILVPSKNKSSTSKTANNNQTNVNATSQDQQSSIFQSILAEESSTEQFVLLYAGFQDRNWFVDKEISLRESKSRDSIRTGIQSLHNRMIVARYDRQKMSLKILQETISLFEQILNRRSMFLFVWQKIENPSELRLICCSEKNRSEIEKTFEEENNSNENGQMREIFMNEGEILEIRFRGNVQAKNIEKRSVQFVFCENFPFSYETKVEEIDRYAQNLSTNFYGFLQIFMTTNFDEFSSKNLSKKRTSIDSLKIENLKKEKSVVEFAVRLAKPQLEARTSLQKSLTSFSSEGVLTPNLFRDLAANLSNDEMKKLGRRLGLTSLRIEAIERDHRDDATYFVLINWLKRLSRAADKTSILINALKLINRRDLAADLQSIRDDKRYEQATSSSPDQNKILSVAFNRICRRDELIKIWKQLARELILTNDEILAIEAQFPTQQERCLRTLQTWKENEPRADVLCLAKIIRTLGFRTLARELEDKL